MNRQTFFLSPKFNKKLIYNLQTNKYQEFINAYVYSIMVKTRNGDPNRTELCKSATKEWNKIKRKDKMEIDDIIRGYLVTPYNLCDIQTVKSKSSRSREESLPNYPTFHTVDPVQEIFVNASVQKKAANKIQIAKKKLTEFDQIYNITTDSQFRLDTYKKIGDLQDKIRFNKKRIIKLKRNANYAQKCREKKRKILNKNQEQSNSIAARAHHHPAWVAVAGVSCTKTWDYPDDDKAKIGLRVPAVGRIFCTLQLVHKPVSVADYDFPLGNGQKVVPSVYLIIKPNESHDELRIGQLAIFVHHQWSLGTSLLSYMQVLENLTLDPKYNDILKTNREIRLIWMLLVDGGLDENSRHLKNIKNYCQLFRKFDLDYLTVRIHAPDQSKYNLVERGMATLSEKLAGITLLVDHFGSHLNTQGKVIDLELTLQNFRYAGESLCDIWQFEGIDKEKEEGRKQQKKKQQDENDILECFVPCCCGPPRAKEATELLLLNNSFLPPIMKAKDRHFTNPIHLLEYYDLLKIPGYDSHCPLLDQTTYSRLYCTVCNKYFPTLAYLTKHKKAMHPASQERPKGKSKNNLNSLDDFSFLTSQQNEMCLREYMSDNE
ncbi:hypothetical protein RclHR1_01870006 [Rhizophagus clarus]|uniref:C2H2-type domain-containing protein n=1 Tax=Rhizophagus clarus TaxID=94130 RepID=A0A2Z6R392_9GLOM|nr:hypothetical protein RclHR1_01870006 [Rhizophagus clarus]GES83807.1 hypothetical protein GLOIN_2v1783204 [Rhizophagus clarus]